MVVKAVKDNNYCFGCGMKNPIGLKLNFRREGDLFWGEFTPQEEHQGYPGMTHGGIIASLLDEVMAINLFSQGRAIVTVEMTVRYIHKIPIGEKVRLYSQQVSHQGRFYEMEGWIEDLQGKVLAKAFGKMLSVKG